MAPIDWNWHTLTTGCYRTAKAIGSYFNSLRNAAILPHDLEFTEHKFCDLIRKASDLPYISVLQHACSVYNCICKNESSYNLSSKLQHEVWLIKQQCQSFICLDCLKIDGRSKDGGKCRTSHP
jgi:hypothetical protein